MKYTWFLFFMTYFPFLALSQSSSMTADEIIAKIDENMSSKNRIFESDMVIYGKRRNRTITSKSFSEGDDKSMTEYLAPEREEGTKMLKLKDQLWIYSPTSDRTILISGHMLKQSVMGSDLSYEDMMEDRILTDLYEATIVQKALFDNRNCWVLELIAKVDDVSYYKRKIWVDQERFIPLKEELFAKSGQLLKKTVLSDIKKIGNRWFPTKINYRDMLKDGDGTDFIIRDIQFDVDIPEHIFTKASLTK